MASGADQILEIVHPRAATALVGHERAEAAFLEAYRGGRLPHAWLIAGPRGIGKATLAYRFARYVLSQPSADNAETLAIPSTSQAFQRVASGGHGDLMAIERVPDEKSGRMRSEIVVDDVRKLHHFFSMTSAETPWRIAVVDSADEMNRSAANALLKVLEEPPARGLLLLVAHAPGRLLPTIRSRCRRLDLRPLSVEAVSDVIGLRRPDIQGAERLALAHLSGGSPGRALEIAASGGINFYHDMTAHLERLPNLDVPALYGFADKLADRNNDGLFRTFASLLEDWFYRLILAASAGPSALGEGHEVDERDRVLMERFAKARPVGRWLALRDELIALFAQADGLKLDQRQVVIDCFTKLQRALS
jgi:DNA polymerase III subunit delta'